MDTQQQRTYALITGGSTGIGLALAHEFAKRNHDIAIVALPDSGQEDAISSITQQYNVNVKSLEINLTENDAVNKVKSWIQEENISVQALVNNAGMGYADSFEELTPSFISTIIDLNIKATLLLTNSLIPELKKNNTSYILNLSSAAAFYSMPYKAAYAASKKFVLDFSLALKEELKESNVNVTAICLLELLPVKKYGIELKAQDGLLENLL